MEFKEVVLEAWVPGKRKIKKKKETWYAVKFGDKEFYMPKEIKDSFECEIYHGSTFSFYFDGNKFFTDDKYHIPAGAERINWHDFIVLHEDAELFKPENLTLLGKKSKLALYLIKNDNESIIYKIGNNYIVVDYPGMTVSFEIEKPVNEETYDLLKKLSKNEKCKYIKIDGRREFTDIRILDYNDVKVYTKQDTEKHQIIALENAELIHRGKDYVAIKGNKTYIVMDHYYLPISSDIITIGNASVTYKNKHKVCECIIPDTIKVLKNETRTYYFEGNMLTGYRVIVTGERSIVEIPNLDSEIIIRKVIRKAEPSLTNIAKKLEKYKEYTYEERYLAETGEVKTSAIKVGFPAELDYKMLEPEFIEEKTFKIRNFLSKPAEIGY